MSIFTQIKDQYTTLPIPKPEKCVGRTYVVTGANTGLGLECAKHLVRLSAKKVVLGVRSLSKGEAAKAKIEEDTGIKGVAEVWPLDLSSADSTKDFARKVLQLDRLDAIIENAGLALPNYTTSDGFETTLTVNVINTFLLATLVFPKLQESAKKSSSPSHLVIVGSDAAWGAKGELEKMNGDMLEGLNEPESMKEGAMKRYDLLQVRTR